MSAPEAFSSRYYCHGCQRTTTEVSVDQQDGELMCLHCGGGCIELIVEDSTGDGSLASFLLNTGSSPAFPHQTQGDGSILLPSPPRPSSSFSSSLTSALPTPTAVPSQCQLNPDGSTTSSFTSSTSNSVVHHHHQPQMPSHSFHQHPFPGVPTSPAGLFPFAPFAHHQNFLPPQAVSRNNGFQVSVSSSADTRLTPGVPGGWNSTSGGVVNEVMFLDRQNRDPTQPPVGFTATVNNVDFTQFMNSLFQNIGQVVETAGFDRVVQFIMENDPNRFGSPPASVAVVASLPEETLTPETAIGDCAICQEDFKGGDTVKRFPCELHSFHASCIGPWLTEHNSCPVCRFELPTDDADYERRRLERQRRNQQSGRSSSTEADVPFHVMTSSTSSAQPHVPP